MIREEAFTLFAFHELELEEHSDFVALADDRKCFVYKLGRLLIGWVSYYISIPRGVVHGEEIVNFCCGCTLDDVACADVVSVLFKDFG